MLCVVDKHLSLAIATCSLGPHKYRQADKQTHVMGSAPPLTSHTGIVRTVHIFVITRYNTNTARKQLSSHSSPPNLSNVLQGKNFTEQENILPHTSLLPTQLTFTITTIVTITSTVHQNHHHPYIYCSHQYRKTQHHQNKPSQPTPPPTLPPPDATRSLGQEQRNN